MKWPKWQQERLRLQDALTDHSQGKRALPGIASPDALETLSLQIIASLRRLHYTRVRLRRPISPDRANPESDMFDPELAAIHHHKEGNEDEAVWLIFLSIHFGKHAKWGWRRAQDVYSGLGEGLWTWDRVSSDPDAFCDWLRRRADEIGGAFGNHRKYESLGADNTAGTGNVVRTYIQWVGPTKSHRQRFSELVREGGNDPHAIFDAFYRSFTVARFGRLGKFDFLALLGRLGFAPLTPGSAYLGEATGPLKGARLLYDNNPNSRIPGKKLDQYLTDLDQDLGVGMQVLEDSLCNWQKSPNSFVHFRG